MYGLQYAKWYKLTRCSIIRVVGTASHQHHLHTSTTTRHVFAIDMPRIPTSLLRKAFTIDPLLPRLLPPCRDLHAAQNELRWLREHAEDIVRARGIKGDHASKSAILRDLVDQRASGRPLQYILGNEYFGNLDIRCRPGVLIPRCVFRRAIATR